MQTTAQATQLQAELRAAVLQEIAVNGLDDPDTLAERLEILPIAADGLLQRPKWSVETSLWVIEQLGLPIKVTITT
jgi:hypothetical protein